jgi:hypothetical protein
MLSSKAHLGPFEVEHQRTTAPHDYLHVQVKRPDGIVVSLTIKLDDEGVVVDAWNHPAGEVCGTMAVEYADFDTTEEE